MAKEVQLHPSFNLIVSPFLWGCILLSVFLFIASFILWFPLLYAIPALLASTVYSYYRWKTTIYTITPSQIHYRENILFVKEGSIDLKDIRKKFKHVLIPGTDIGNLVLETAAQSTSFMGGDTYGGDIELKYIDRLSEVYELINDLEQEAKRRYVD
jgi:hypothetical protein